MLRIDVDVASRKGAEGKLNVVGQVQTRQVGSCAEKEGTTDPSAAAPSHLR